MIHQNTGGSIVFTASISAHSVNFPQPQVAYNVSKGALLQLKSSLAAEWARHGIRVNSVSPGYMDTVLNEGAGLAPVREIWARRNPMGRMGDPSELAGTVILLCSPAGRYINGADILVDGPSCLSGRRAPDDSLLRWWIRFLKLALCNYRYIQVQVRDYAPAAHRQHSPVSLGTLSPTTASHSLS
jgi:hypothetical protein